MTKDSWPEELALIVNGQEGEQAMPAGNPLTAMETGPENPFKPLTETVTGALVVPIFELTVKTETDTEKSGAGLTPMVVEPETEETCVEVAVTVTCVAAETGGAV